MALNYSFPWTYNADDAGALTLSSAVDLVAFGSYEIEWHLTPDSTTSSMYAFGSNKANPSGALYYITYQNTLDVGTVEFTGLPTVNQGDRVRFVLGYDPAATGAEVTAKMSINGAAFVDLGSVTSASSPLPAFSYMAMYATPQRLARLIVRDAPDSATVLHDFNPSKVALNAGGYGDRGDADTVAGSEEIMYDTVGGISGTTNTAGFTPFIPDNDIVSVNNGNPIEIGSTAIPVVLGGGTTIDSVELTDGTKTYVANFTHDGSENLTFDLPLTSDDTMVDLGALTLNVKSGTSTFSKATTLTVPAGYTEVILGGYVSTDETSYSYGQSWTPLTDDVYFHLATTDFTIATDNTLTPVGDAPWEHTVWHLSASGLRKTTVSSGYGVITVTKAPPINLKEQGFKFLTTSNKWNQPDLQIADAENGVVGLTGTNGVVSTEQAKNGLNSIKTSISANSVGTLSFGGVMSTRRFYKGDTIWIAAWCYYPTGFQIDDAGGEATSGRLKFLRLKTADVNNNHIGYNDLLINMEAYNYGDAAFSFTYEGEQPSSKWYYLGDRVTDKVPRGQWVHYQIAITLDNVPEAEGGSGNVKFWQGDTLIGEITTAPTLQNADDYAKDVYLHTYWNGESPQTQHAYFDDITVTNIEPSGVDANGNKKIITGA